MASANLTTSYAEFLASKSQLPGGAGFEPTWMPDFLFDFQKHLVEWSIRRGRAAIFADCGLGKTPMQLVWAENVVRHTNRPVLILTPLGVTHQTVREAEKFGIESEVSRTGKFTKKIVVTNYEKLHYFNTNDFAGVVCDESSILKNMDGKRKDAIVEFMRTRPYRLLCTATAAPNDYVELGTSSEALGEMGQMDMITKFFRQSTQKDHLGWGRTKYIMRSHAVRDFWRWVCSWARACRKPSDLGFDDSRFELPPMHCREHIVDPRTPRSDMLFDLPAITLEEQRAERRRTLHERCELAASLVNGTGKPAVAWCHLNDEGDLLEKLIPDAVQVSGKDSDEAKEGAFSAFETGKVRVLISKPQLAGFGLNWQHCAHQTFFPSHSFERWYQAVRRCWRFGQQNAVHVDVITSPGEANVLANMQRKAEQADEMFANLVRLMNDHLQINRANPFQKQQEVPSWL